MSSCKLASSDLLQAGDVSAFGRFEKDVDIWQHSPPFHGAPANASTQPLQIRDYVDGRLVGYLNEVAITGPDRAAEDAYARSLGYSTGKQPLVPLRGPVVAHNDQVLEVYENVWIFRTIDGARAALSTFRASRGGLADMSTTAVDFHVGDEPVGFSMAPTDNDPQVEHWVHLETRFGTIVLSLTIQGGKSVSHSDAESLAAVAAGHLLNSCAMEKR